VEVHGLIVILVRVLPRILALALLLLLLLLPLLGVIVCVGGWEGKGAWIPGFADPERNGKDEMRRGGEGR
jgi:hypothetical protein